ncbi:hypothetical protein [Aquimarina algiphila]|uniref:hypothetical protein n=1 Tax=Aquimarina algiphila TaxID=2047982 RepID=UPI00232EAA0D|nr:hypothetical protein [Aquimarina algiphila]
MELTKIIEVFDKFIFYGGDNVLGLNAYVDYVIRYSYILASILMIILVGSKVFSYFMNPSGNLDPYVLVKPVLILVALALYKPLVEILLVKPTNIILDITDAAALHITNTSSLDAFFRIFINSITFIQTGGFDSNGNPIVGVYDILQISTVLEVLHLLIHFVSLAVAAYIIIRQLILKAIYFMLGTLVLPLSLIPGNFKILQKWFFSFFALLLWIPLLRMIQTIIILIHTAPVTGWAQPLFSIVLQIVMIFYILNVPKYANLLVSEAGEADGGGYLNTAVREMWYKRSGQNRSK